MSGQRKTPTRNKRSIHEILSNDIELTPPLKKAKICDLDDEFLTGETQMSESTNDVLTEEVDERTAPRSKRIFAVFVCGPDPSQCVEDPTAPNRRGKTYIDLLQTNDVHENAHEEWKEFMIYRDEFPSASEISSFTAIIITGSKHDAFTDDVEWKLKLQAIILDIYENRPAIKILGVCFGHQVIVHSLRYSEDAFVGRNKARSKMELGLISVNLTDTFHKFWARFDIKVDAKALKIHEAHQDVVYQLPAHIKDAGVMAHSQYTDVEMYHIGDNIIGVQGHPEFTTTYLMNAIERNTKYMSKIYTDEELKNIVATMENCEANREEWKHVFGKWIRF